MPKLNPIGNDVIVHPFEQPEMTAGGLHVPDRSKRRQNQGIIIAKGPLVSDEVDVADHIIFSGYTGDKVVFEDSSPYFVVPEPLIIAVVENSDVILMDTVSLKAELEARKGEILSYIGKDYEDVVKEVFESIFDRIDGFTMHRGFEF